MTWEDIHPRATGIQVYSASKRGGGPVELKQINTASPLISLEEYMFRRIIWLSISGLAAGAGEKERSQRREKTKGRQGLMKMLSFLLKMKKDESAYEVPNKRAGVKRADFRSKQAPPEQGIVVGKDCGHH
jgi:hypothetical protein